MVAFACGSYRYKTAAKIVITGTVAALIWCMSDTPRSPDYVARLRRRVGRWQCQTCGRLFAGEARPVHEHPLSRLCRYQTCPKIVNPALDVCGDEHSIRHARMMHGLTDDLIPRGPCTGLAVLHRRLELGISRVEIARRLGIRWQAIYWAEVMDSDLLGKGWHQRLSDFWAEPAVHSQHTSPPAPPKSRNNELNELLSFARDLEILGRTHDKLAPHQVEILLSELASRVRSVAARFL